jgi:hypothetical protein
MRRTTGREEAAAAAKSEGILDDAFEEVAEKNNR